MGPSGAHPSRALQDHEDPRTRSQPGRAHRIQGHGVGRPEPDHYRPPPVLELPRPIRVPLPQRLARGFRHDEPVQRAAEPGDSGYWDSPRRHAILDANHAGRWSRMSEANRHATTFRLRPHIWLQAAAWVILQKYHPAAADTDAKGPQDRLLPEPDLASARARRARCSTPEHGRRLDSRFGRREKALRGLTNRVPGPSDRRRSYAVHGIADRLRRGSARSGHQSIW